MKYYDPKNNQLVFVAQQTTADFWDRHWHHEDLKGHIESGRKIRFIPDITRRFLKPGPNTKILEGGCGRGQIVYALSRAGYNTFGVDYAKQTITAIKRLFPQLQVAHGDVAHLDFPDNFFDGYWSIGVIEHYYDGYEPLLQEAARVLKEGGYFFVTFPHLSPLRKLKIKRGAYPITTMTNIAKMQFYQFAFDVAKVAADLTNLDFAIVLRQPFDGLKGLKDEVAMLQAPLQSLYDGQGVAAAALRFGLSRLLAPATAHAMLLVGKKHATQ